MKNILLGFWKWKQSLPTTERGNKTMYDVSAWHKYLSEEELFAFYFDRIYNKKK